ncbi:MAG: dienelactone hydrolase family protein [Thiohalocapsa sp.]|jgi:dienelactone hydrolase|uniref:dienelactone hydrolase family protein n=1 Tax=Thiohalocapsa sp. TaxID=2497641 RepID=UPI0025FF1974|nr:dienelactone hydrolase family protein [Thiohalocapsa sp.]MCG6941868.1 dienelactone hydrolase family protein [Thiohalocapsa sp.]
METTSLHRAEEVHIPTEAGDLPGFLDLPHQPRGLVLFAHGSGSSRFSRRNREVAQTLNHGGIATLLFDLLTAPEHDLDQRTAELRFNIPLLTRRLIQAVDWAQGDPRTAALSIGLFGASTGAAAALGAAAARPEAVRAVVSRGGRPDLAADALGDVHQPTLFIVGGLDGTVQALNREAAARMPVPPEIRIIGGASHLFEEPGKLERVAAMARDWFIEHL